MNIKTSKLKALHDAIEAAGGQTALANRLNETKLARKIGRKLKQQNINIWIGLGHIPTGWVLPVEEVVGISRTTLRPDVYPSDPSPV